MSNNPSKLSNALRKKFIKIEKQIVQYANATSTVSQPLQDNCKLLFNKPSLLIRNGYDFEINKTKHRNEVFTINYVGTFYGKIKPTNFFAALIKCQSKIENIKINFIGRCSNTIIPSVLIDKVQVHGVVDAHTSIAMMQQADVLLLLLNKNKNYRGIYSTKVFEYLGCCRPILALIDKNDVVNELLESCKAAYFRNRKTDNACLQRLEKQHHVAI
jgi:glycosyltransferase involved in cell wall biosynthesis